MTRRATEGTLPSPGTPTAAICLAFLLGSAASANLRAPVVVPDPPSTALAATDPRLVVEGERLRFACAATSCDVTAEYDVASEAAVRVRLDFILPVEGPVTAETNGERGDVSVVAAEPLRPSESRGLTGGGTGALYRASFESAFRAGRNRLAVSYRQPLGTEEVDYGYGKKGRTVHRFRYELWPLREWSRSAAFRIRLAVSMERPAPGWWKSLFGTVKSLTCISSDPGAPLPQVRREQKGGELWYEVDVGPAIPDRVTCYLGDEDLMPRY